MKKILSFALFFVLFLLVINIASAWTGYTHDWICSQAGLSNLDCHSADNSQVQKNYPGLSPTYHHCSNNLDNCSARISAAKFKLNNTAETSGFAAHLYADALVPVHWYSYDYNSCHGIFEKKVSDALKNSNNFKIKIFNDIFDMSAWSVNMTCYAKNIDKNVNVYADNNYMNYVVNSVSESMNSTAKETGPKVYDLTYGVIAIFVILILLLILFFVMGFRNKKK